MSETTHEPGGGSSGATAEPPASGNESGDSSAPALPALPTLPAPSVHVPPPSTSPLATDAPDAAQLLQPQPVAPTSPPLVSPAAQSGSTVTSMAGPGVALVAGRALLLFAVLAVGGAALTAADGGDGPDRFWPTVAVAAGIAAAGVVGVAWWSAALTECARALRLRTWRFGSMLALWLLPVGWATFASLTLLKIPIDAEVDPMPGVAAIGFAIALAVPYTATHRAWRLLRRGRPNAMWWFMYATDLVTFGCAWYLLSDWRADLGDWKFWPPTRLALTLDGSVFLFLALLGSMGLAVQAPRLVRQRMRRLEMIEADDADAPQWFQAGVARRQILASDVARAAAEGDGTMATLTARKLVNAAPARIAATVLHVLWGLALAYSVVAYLRAVARTEFADMEEEFARDWWQQLDLVVVIVLGGYLIAHGVWGMITLVNARRVSVHATAPLGLGVLFLPFPVCALMAVPLGVFRGADEVRTALTVGAIFGFVCYLISIECVNSGLGSVRASSRRLRVWLGVLLLFGAGRLLELWTVRFLENGKSQYVMLGVMWAIGTCIVLWSAYLAYRAMSDVSRRLAERSHGPAAPMPPPPEGDPAPALPTAWPASPVGLPLTEG